MKNALLIITALTIVACDVSKQPQNSSQPVVRTATLAEAEDQFGDYWYQGKAEITSYQLEQARYGEIHQGHAVMIFVTEDFSRKKQVKLDNPQSGGDDAVKVLKLNATREFNTGIYPYSMMTSVFSPVYPEDDMRTIKVTTSAQEWCGSAFTQLNQVRGGYDVRQFSYFESEGDRRLKIENATLEDEVWTTIRLDPTRLPTGNLKMVPGGTFQRLRHSDWSAQDVVAVKQSNTEKGATTYTLSYPQLDRTLSITFRSEFPFEIESWEEHGPSGFGTGRKMLKTRATRMKRIMSDYWNRNSVADVALRTNLDLPS